MQRSPSTLIFPMIIRNELFKICISHCKLSHKPENHSKNIILQIHNTGIFETKKNNISEILIAQWGDVGGTFPPQNYSLTIALCFLQS